uniref:Uncharacterized protein n=1 Tax=Plectus sambesii TaxID=2011161 RepID=A0A914VCW6_9BILA
MNNTVNEKKDCRKRWTIPIYRPRAVFLTSQRTTVMCGGQWAANQRRPTAQAAIHNRRRTEAAARGSQSAAHLCTPCRAELTADDTHFPEARRAVRIGLNEKHSTCTRVAFLPSAPLFCSSSSDKHRPCL